MREIAIVPRRGLEVAMELYASIVCLRRGGINPRTAVNRQVCAVVWVDDEETRISVDLLRNKGFEAAAVTETEEPF
jgi:hypothetical protein